MTNKVFTGPVGTVLSKHFFYVVGGNLKLHLKERPTIKPMMSLGIKSYYFLLFLHAITDIPYVYSQTFLEKMAFKRNNKNNKKQWRQSLSLKI